MIPTPLKRVARRLLGDRVVGMMDYYRHPEWRVSWGGALNGQSHRQRMVEAFIRDLPLHAIVETGTYRGTTTAYLAAVSALPIYTVEVDRRKQGFSFAMLRQCNNVRRYASATENEKLSGRRMNSRMPVTHSWCRMSSLVWG